MTLPRLRAFGPAVPRPSGTESLRAALGAALGLCLAGALLVSAGTPGAALIPPFGASAFLLFAVPNSPLAQPWPTLVGNTSAALVALAVLRLPLPAPVLAGVAVGAAILAMAALRAPHPPAGAVALLVALSPPAAGSPAFALHPVGTGTLALILAALAWNRLTGRVYPFRLPATASPHGTADPAPDRRLGLRPEDLSAILSRLRLAPNLGAEDLGRAIEAAEAEATARHLRGLSAADIMSRDVVSVAPDTAAAALAAAFRRHGFNTLPVRRADGGLAGLVRDQDLIGADPATTAQALARPAQALPPGAGLADLLPLLADGHQQSVPIVEGGRLTGIVTRSDLLALLALKLRHEDDA